MGIVVTDSIITSAPSDVYATHDADLGRGGYRSVANLLERDQISSERRKEGMVVFVNSNLTEYRLQGGTENIHWAVVEGGGGGGTTSNRNLIVRVTSDYQMVPENRIMLCDCSLGNIIVTLPQLDDGISTYTTAIKKIDSSANKVFVVSPTGSIDGYESREIRFKNTSISIVSLDNEFYII